MNHFTLVTQWDHPQAQKTELAIAVEEAQVFEEAITAQEAAISLRRRLKPLPARSAAQN